MPPQQSAQIRDRHHDAGGRLLFHVLAAISEFRRDLIRDRVLAGLRRARSQGRRLGRPKRHQVDAERARTLMAWGQSLRATARTLGVPHKLRERIQHAERLVIPKGPSA